MSCETTVYADGTATITLDDGRKVTMTSEERRALASCLHTIPGLPEQSITTGPFNLAPGYTPVSEQPKNKRILVRYIYQGEQSLGVTESCWFDPWEYAENAAPQRIPVPGPIKEVQFMYSENDD